jgi:hypothetical protein
MPSPGQALAAGRRRPLGRALPGFGTQPHCASKIGGWLPSGSSPASHSFLSAGNATNQPQNTSASAIAPRSAPTALPLPLPALSTALREAVAGRTSKSLSESRSKSVLTLNFPISGDRSPASSSGYQTCCRSCGTVSIIRASSSATRSKAWRPLSVRKSLMTTWMRSWTAHPPRRRSGLMASGRVDEKTSARLRRSLLAYCHRDTWALVRLHQALKVLAASI